MMTEIEIETIRLALDTEVEHKDYAKHDLAARKILNSNEAENKGQTLPIDSVCKSVAKKYAEFCVECDRKGLPLLLLDDYIKQYCC